MQIEFHREGFANNSSSSHSIVGVNKLGMDVIADNYDWAQFFCASADAKAHYLASNLRTLIFNEVNSELYDTCIQTLGIPYEIYKQLVSVTDIVKEYYEHINMLSGLRLPQFCVLEEVDHQSVIHLPKCHTPAGIDGNRSYDGQFLKSFFKSIIESPRLAIRGGNDNEEDPNSFVRELKRIQGVEFLKVEDLPAQEREVLYLYKYLAKGASNNLSSRKVEGREAFVLSDSQGGDIIIVSFDGAKVTKLDVPYLVDLKITNQCPYQCAFCYQGSSAGTDGASDVGSYDMQNMARLLQTAGVMEVALGGGEPTVVTNLSLFVNILRYHKLKVGVTTRNLNPEYWLTPISRGGYLPYVGAIQEGNCYPNSIAFSITSKEDLPKFMECASTLGGYGGIDITAQIIVGVMPVEEFREVTSSIFGSGEKITFLGYKNQGRGAIFTPKMSTGQFLEVINEHDALYSAFGVDSVLVSECRQQLKDLGVNEKYLGVSEGRHTCYIDMVGKYIAPSSFCKPNEIVPYTTIPKAEEFKAIFSKF